MKAENPIVDVVVTMSDGTTVPIEFRMIEMSREIDGVQVETNVPAFVYRPELMGWLFKDHPDGGPSPEDLPRPDGPAMPVSLEVRTEEGTVQTLHFNMADVVLNPDGERIERKVPVAMMAPTLLQAAFKDPPDWKLPTPEELA